MFQLTANGSGDAIPDRASIRTHYDRLSSLYQIWWGEHIHHGYWMGEASVTEAQVNLVRELAQRAHVPYGGVVLDIGCGLGGSACWLARQFAAHVIGITNSPVQVRLATRLAHRAHVNRLVQFTLADASTLQIPAASIDVVWIIESSEHVADKADLIHRLAAALKPGGVLALCAWVVGVGVATKRHHALLSTICESMLCPSLASLQEYVHWAREARLHVLEAEHVTAQVRPTWKHASRLLHHPVIQQAMQAADHATQRFLAAFPVMGLAYDEGALAYGLVVARKAA